MHARHRTRDAFGRRLLLGWRWRLGHLQSATAATAARAGSHEIDQLDRLGVDDLLGVVRKQPEGRGRGQGQEQERVERTGRDERRDGLAARLGQERQRGPVVQRDAIAAGEQPRQPDGVVDRQITGRPRETQSGERGGGLTSGQAGGTRGLLE